MLPVDAKEDASGMHPPGFCGKGGRIDFKIKSRRKTPKRPLLGTKRAGMCSRGEGKYAGLPLHQRGGRGGKKAARAVQEMGTTSLNSEQRSSVADQETNAEEGRKKRARVSGIRKLRARGGSTWKKKTCREEWGGEKATLQKKFHEGGCGSWKQGDGPNTTKRGRSGRGKGLTRPETDG